MRAIIGPSFYRDLRQFDADCAGLFRHAWIFACLRSELPADGDYLRLASAGRELIIRNSRGIIRAFANVCSHRHAQLCFEARGSGPMRCPYHGWVYNHEGMPVGIPFKEQFPEVTADPQAYRLEEYSIDCAGEFVFVRLAPHGIGLGEYLGAHAVEFLRRASGSMDQVIDEFERNVPANWKTVVENSLEGYHVPIVHQRTLGAADGMATGYEAVVENFDSPLHSFMTKRAEPKWLAKWNRMSRQLGNWPFRFDYYVHYHFFPNLTITSFLGHSFHIQRFNPLDLHTTRVQSRILPSKFSDQTEIGRRMIERVHADSVEFTHRVFAEDSDICSKVQAGMQQAQRPAVLAREYELRVLHFQRAYLAAVNDACSPT